MRRASGLIALAAVAAACGGEPRRPNVLVYLVDTLRADQLGLYGSSRDTSPRLDAFARRAVVFDRAFASLSWTRPSVASLLTGLHPQAHGVRDMDDLMADRLFTMAEAFQAAGYETAGFSSSVMAAPRYNFAQGFDHFLYLDRSRYFPDPSRRGRFDYVPVPHVFRAVAEWLARPHARPFFLYVHTMEPHSRYAAPRAYRHWGNRAAARYDAEVRFADDYFGRLVDLLDERGLLDDTLVVFTADHGEELGERGNFTHGHTLYNELLRVPLVFRHPAFAPGRRDEVVRLLDVLPTLAEWLALPLGGARLQGRSFLPLLEGGRLPPGPARVVFAQARYRRLDAESLEMEGMKLIHVVRDRDGPRDAWELYDVARDPGERHDLAAKLPEVVAAYRRQLERLEAAAGTAASPSAPPDADTEAALRALGYVD